ncbi:hypothetical protein CYMTET_16881 [Cymbomonas tetramitiformis]|uniref:Uncharacterized protein n=1 Tax=Cymbomonas tetramitiformis TaxID=36881 RepID=A0AAE0L7P7_9CHLO|nr:hypothetical protein CYMTET_16881 [Cymbomonas tetramitiformis]
MLPKRTRKGLAGFRVGARPDPQVGFDTRQKKAIPQCPRCPTAGDGHKYHSWDDCPLGGRTHAAGTTAAYCHPAADATPEVLHTLALCQVFQSAADNGPATFSAACEQYGAPAVLNDGASAGGVDISAYGFVAGDCEDSDGEDMDVEAELQQLRREVTTAAEASMVQASFTPPVSAVAAATAANGAPSVCISAPTDEFAAGVAAAVHGGGSSAAAREPVICYGQACIFGGIDTLSPVVRAQVLAAFQAAALSGGADIASGGAPGGAPGGGPVLASGTSSAG